MTRAPARHIIGCMTGTSLDGLDVALVRITGHARNMTAQPLAAHHATLGELAEKLRFFASGGAAPPLDYLRAARALGALHVDAVAALLAFTSFNEPLDAIVAHGQTICHQGDEGLSWQLMDPWPLVRRFGAPVCYDLRQADLIAGGQGAPLTPLADWVLYRDPDQSRLIINLGGICNVTHLPAGASPDDVRGMDIGPCNLLLDGLVRALYPDRAYDEGGHLAAAGHAHEAFDQAVREHPFFTHTATAPVSLGREQFTSAWIAQLIERFQMWPPEDVLASAVEGVARLIGQHADALDARELILAGGSAHNTALVRRITHHAMPRRVRMSDELGVPVDGREAAAFAVLGALAQDGVPITLEQVTAAQRPGRAGAWVYP